MQTSHLSSTPTRTWRATHASPIAVLVNQGRSIGRPQGDWIREEGSAVVKCWSLETAFLDHQQHL